MTQNPFKPTAGKIPPLLIGRQPIIDDFAEGLENGAGAPGRLMLITGQRGYGKTVMLSEFARLATAQGWTVVSETASFGLCDRIVAALAPQGLKLKSANIGPSFSIPGIASASLGAASFAPSEQCALTLREAINQRLKKEAPGKGIVFTIDEAQAASPDDMVALATALQHVIRDQDLTNTPDSEKKGIAFVFAGLPSIVDDLTGNDILTFLRRSQRRILKEIPLLEVRDAYATVASKSGKEIPEEIALDAARKAGGHPYMIQLVGYYMWRAAERRGSRIIESCDVLVGESDALLAFYEAICAPLYYGLRSPQRFFIEAMAKDDDAPSKVSDIAERTGRTASWAAKYRASLIREHVIESAGYGLVCFSTPHLGDYLRNEILWPKE